MSTFDRGAAAGEGPARGRALAEARRLRRRAWWIAGGYFAIAAFWILGSDRLLDAVVSDPELRSSYGTAKGWGFVTLTALLLFLLIRRAFARFGDALVDLERSDLRLGETNEALRSLIESIPQIVWIASDDGSVVDVNRRWQEFAGGPVTGVAGWLAFVHPDDEADARARWLGAAAAGAPFECELRLRRVDGAHHWMLGRALPLRDPAGEVVRWFGTFTDIEELKQVQQRIAAQARLLDLTQDAIVVHGLDGRVQYWNKGAERLHGWTADEAIGRLVTDLCGPDLDRLEDVVEVLLEFGKWSGELELATRDGAAVIAEGRWTLVRGMGDEPASVLAVNTDVTRRKLMEAQFLRTQRLESIGTLAGGIAHDLNNLLAPIAMGVELLRLRTDERDTLELIDAMDVSAQRCAALVQRVLGYARGADARRGEVHLDDLIGEVVAIVRATFPKDLAVVTEIAGDLLPVIGDSTQLSQVLLNLCVNARDAMGGHGRLVIRAHNRGDASGPPGGDLDLPLAATPGILVEVVDDGAGIPPELVDRIFEPFVTTKESDGGTGLGLSTVRGIVEGHGGIVAVESTLGTGTCFSVFLPTEPLLVK